MGLGRVSVQDGDKLSKAAAFVCACAWMGNIISGLHITDSTLFYLSSY